MIQVQGNGNIVSIEKQVSSFLRLHIDGKGVTELIQSNEEKVVIEIDENLQDYFQAVNSGKTLYVSAEMKFRKPVFTKCHIKVYLRQLDSLVIRCNGGDVICPEPINLTVPLEIKLQTVGNTSLNINVPAIKILNQGEGNVEIKGKCGNMEIKNMGEGHISAKELIADDLALKNMGEGDIEVYASKNISISNFGEGNISYYGDAVLKSVKQFGEGIVKHMD